MAIITTCDECHDPIPPGGDAALGLEMPFGKHRIRVTFHADGPARPHICQPCLLTAVAGASAKEGETESVVPLRRASK